MRWKLIMLFDDAALPFVDSEDDHWIEKKEDFSTVGFDELAGAAYEAALTLLEGRVDLNDVEVNLIVSERFEHQTWVTSEGSRQSQSSNEWRRAFDSELPNYAGVTASAIQYRLADHPAARSDIEQEWIGTAATTLTSIQDVDLAVRLLQGVRSLRRQLVPGARCFGEFDGNPAVYDCRRYVMGPGDTRYEGKLVLVEIEVREGG